MTKGLEQYLKDYNKSIIVVDNTLDALKKLATYKQSLFKNPVIAITGSAGKTSTKDLVYLVLKEKYQVYKTMGNKNNHIGLPLTILNRDNNPDLMVLEMGMNHLGEISSLAKIVKPNVAIITNVGTAHIGNLGSRENILKAKLEIIENFQENDTLIINNDNDLLHEWYLNNKDKYHIITFGIKNESDVMAYDITIKNNYSTFKCLDTLIKVPIAGEHFIYNSLGAIATGLHFKMNISDIAQGIKKFKPEKNRMNIINKDNYTIINDCYNANYDSLKYAIKYLGKQVGRKIAVLGTMQELGKFSESLHEKIGNIVYNEKIDILITVGEYTDLINKKAEELGFNANNNYHLENKEEAIKLINKIKKENDVILVKASNAGHFEEIIANI